ncbi:flavin reductase like domain [Trichoderma arundinaceum]|uniref:Flavin reductase like domain n=1 Tax=Trichoderma arundinaceum TaxID=490622 RepID=A0A395P4Z5_TRIAR|nr:flavin reductase like domain [Trichoderma arundinaceum]
MSQPDIFYQPLKGESSGLPHDPFKSFVIPRPIGWISTTSQDGKDNLAPFSQFQNVSFDPPTILFIGHQDLYKKRSRDTVMNCIETNEFVWNMATYDQRENVNDTGKETWEDEFQEFNIKKAPSRLVRPPRVADSPVSFECRVHSIIRVSNEFHGKKTAGPHMVGNSDIVIGRVMGIHVKGEYITPDGLFDVLKAAPIARLGYRQYTYIDNVFEMTIPTMPDEGDVAATLSGSLTYDDSEAEDETESK